MHALRHPAHRNATWWLVALVGSTLALLLATPAISHAEEANPNNYSCFGGIAAGKPEVGSEEQQVAYTFHCNGPITGYQLQAQIPVTGVEAAPLVSNIPSGTPVSDTFPAPAKSRVTPSTASARPGRGMRRSPASSRSAQRCAPSHAWTRC